MFYIPIIIGVIEENRFVIMCNHIYFLKEENISLKLYYLFMIFLFW